MIPDSNSNTTSTRDDALTVLTHLREAGHVAYFAGGCVRDLLLKLDPSDYDVATDAPPDRVRSLFRNSQAVGAAFGVVLVRFNASQIEVATFRTDGNYLDGRRPESVRFTTAEEDARRRDFTINGLFLDPISGDVIDFVGGRDDLRNRQLRAIGEPAARFAEDHLRMLRAIRFAARFSFTIEPGTAAAIGQQAGNLRGISPERIAEELRRMLTPARSRVIAWQLLWELGLMTELMRQLSPADGEPRTREQSLLARTSPDSDIPFGLALAAITFCYQRRMTDPSFDARELLSDRAVGKTVRAMRQTLRISNDESELLEATLGDLHPLLADEPPTLAMKKRFLARPSSPQSRAFLHAMGDIGIQTARVDELLSEFDMLDREIVAPSPLLNGTDLIEIGLKPGPAFKRVLDGVYDAQLESRVSTREDAISLARALLAVPRSK